MIHNLLNICISMVWLVNGLYCKLLDLVPRHSQIVARVLDISDARLITRSIGCAEILMSVWILSGLLAGLCTVTQAILVAAMNIIEFIKVPDLLLFGRFNIVIAALFILVLLSAQFIFRV